MEALPICVKERPALCRAVDRLCDMGRPFLHLGEDLKPGDQFGQMYPLRSWLNLFPDSLVPLIHGDVWAPIFLAHFYLDTGSFPSCACCEQSSLCVSPCQVGNRDFEKRFGFAAL